MSRGVEGALLGALLLLVIVLILLVANDGASDPCALRYPRQIGCIIDAHEGLAGGLFGAAGGIFAGWLAYRATNDQVRQARREALLARRAVVLDQIETQVRELDLLRTAGAYLLHMAKSFPDENAKSGFVSVLLSLRERAGDTMSFSAVRAPVYGAQIQTQVAHLQELAKSLSNQLQRKVSTIAVMGSDNEAAVREVVEGMRKLAGQIKVTIEQRERVLEGLLDERTALGQSISSTGA